MPALGRGVGTVGGVAAPLVFVVAEPDVHRALRAAEGLTVWADRFPTCAEFLAARDRGELPLDLRPAVVVVSDALPDGATGLVELLSLVGDLAVVVHDPAHLPPRDLPGVRRPARPAELRAAVWARAGRRPTVLDDQPPEPVGDVGDAPAAAVRVPARALAGHVVAVTAEGPSASATTSAVAFALGARLALHGRETCVAGLHDDGGVLEALVTARRPSLAELRDRAGADVGDPDALLAAQVRDNATGVRVLLPGRGLRLDDLDPADLPRLLDGLRARADLVIADLPVPVAATTGAGIVLDAVEAVTVVTDGGAGGPGGPAQEAASGLPRALTVRTWDAEGVAMPEARTSTDGGAPVAVLPTGRREGLGHEGLRYVTGGEDVERALDAALAVLVPALAPPPAPAVEAQFWRRHGIARRRRARR